MPTSSEDAAKHQARAQRIIDVAIELVLRWGYKRVTIEEIAKRAGIGKGTVYLHWKTRDDLFYAVLAREGADALDELLEELRADPRTALPHRLIRATFVARSSRPLLKALLVADTELLGRLVERPEAAQLQSHKLVTSEEYFGLLREHGLVHTDVDLTTQLYTLAAAVIGFYTADPLISAQWQLPLPAKADALAAVIRSTFELPGAADHPALPAVATKLVGLFDQLRADFRAQAEGRPPQ